MKVETRDIKLGTLVGVLAAVIGGGTGTFAGGSRADDRVNTLEKEVKEIAVTQGKILTELDHLKASAEESKQSNKEQDGKLTEIITILKERGP